jgi:glycosyltransferase involved in cell wall biosynthesis
MSPTVCWIAHRDPKDPRAGGAEKSIVEIATRLLQRGWEVQLLTGGFLGAESRDNLSGIQIIRGSGPARLHFELPSIIRSAKAADVFVEDLAHAAPFLTERLTRTPGVVFFRHLHRRTLAGQVRLPLRLMLELAELSYPIIYRRWSIVAPSASAVEDLRNLGISASRIHAIGYGVDSEKFRPGILSETPSLVHFAGLRKYKRADHALHVLKILSEEGVAATLTVIGDGPELNTLKNLSRRLGIDGRVFFTGRLTEVALRNVVSRSWVHIQCSASEGWGLTVAEAASSGVPTVAYRVPGLMDSVSPGVSGSLVEDGDVHALAREVICVIHERTKWTGLCRESVSGRSWDMVAGEWDTLLKQVSQSS